MRKLYTLVISILLGTTVFSQTISSNNFAAEFEAAYLAYPEIPRGILEGVAFAQTRITHITGNNEGCIGLPQVSGVMGLTENGQGYFRNNLITVSENSGFSINEIKINPQINIMAYAMAYADYLSILINTHNENETNFFHYEFVLRMLSEIPMDNNPVNQYALSCFSFEVLRFMNNPQKQVEFNLPDYQLDFEEIYGAENFEILSSSNVTVEANNVIDENGNEFISQTKSLEYAPALWVATPTCNYSSRSGTAISAVTIHTIQGTYAGAISWAQNCSSNVSYHYVARSSDGQITQMVYEADKGWHVGSENPYTIGIEHEGYVSNPAWYTEAMYVGSAGVVKDICNSGYGINPLRTFQGPATSGSNVLGSCTKIKGHQHFPSQTHTDPGINWNWEHYYQLINNPPTVITYTASTGTIYDSGGALANYSNDERKLYLIQPGGVVNITINFISFNLETNWDYLYVYDGTTTSAPLLATYTGTSIPGNVSSTGPSILVEFRSDCSTTASGYQFNWTSNVGPSPGDVIPPSTTVSFLNDWKTTDFNADFTDADNIGGTGVLHQFYQVIDFDGTEWRANANNGFFSDNFDLAIHPEWTSATGNWSIISGYLNQSDEANTNTNIYASLNQNTDDKFLYHWGGMISGTGINKRAGFHFMCDNASLPNRGNSYFIWFREDDNKVQIYKVVADVFTLEADLPLSINANQWYDFKTAFDKNSGSIQVWVNNILVASWTDTAPHTTGNAISFRSGDCAYDVNDLKIYHERDLQELITVGITDDVRFQNPNSLTPSAKIKSIVIDSSSNVSSISSQLANVDWTSPADLIFINDGEGADISVTSSNTELSANWSPTFDTHSDIASYWYAIGSSSGATDVVNWTDNWFDTIVTHTGLGLTYGTTYYFTVKAENGAGLFSNPINSDGQLLSIPVNPPVASFNVMNTFVCVTDSVQFLNSSNDATTYSWSVPGAIPTASADANPYFQFPTSGTYEVTLIADGPGGTDSEIQLITIEAHGVPVASFAQSSTIVNVLSAFVTFTNSSTNSNGYLWNFGDGDVSTDFEPWHNYNAVGIYSVSLIAINGTCPNDTTWSTVEVTADAATDDFSLTVFSIHPNPSSDFVTIKWSENYIGKQITLSLLDARGRVIMHSENINSNENLLIHFADKNIEKGIYFIKVQIGETIVMQKLIVN